MVALIDINLCKEDPCASENRINLHLNGHYSTNEIDLFYMRQVIRTLSSHLSVQSLYGNNSPNLSARVRLKNMVIFVDIYSKFDAEQFYFIFLFNKI